MMKNYLTIILLLLLLAPSGVSAQAGRQVTDDSYSESISIYPNPATNGKISISSKSSEAKEIEIFDILGKKVMQTVVSSNKEVNISNLNAGVYIITIKEEDVITTRKLIVR